MKENLDKKLPYEVPFIAKYKFQRKLLIAFIFLTIFFLFVSFIAFRDKDFIISIIGLIFGLFFLYFIVAISLLKRYYIEITDTYIKVKTGLINKTIHWNEVVGINLDSDNHKSLIGIITKKKALRQQNLLTRIIDALFYGPYPLVISLNFLPHVDVERLVLTIENKINNQDVEKFLKREGLLESDEKEMGKNEAHTSNIFKTFIYCFIVAVIIGLSYGYLLKIFHENTFLLVVGIPVLANWLIVYIYHKNYKEHAFNISQRLIIGLISILPIIIGFISKVYFEAKMLPNLNNFMIVVRNLSRSLKYDKAQLVIVLLVTGYVFVLGTLQGKTFKIQHKFYKLLHQYKKYGDYYCIKEGAFFQIYLIDPEDFEHEYVDLLAVHIGEGCLIEKNKKRLGGLYIPKELIKKINIMVSEEQYVDIEGMQYFYINLGNPEKSKPKPYHLPCIIFLNKNKEMCMIQTNYFSDK